MINNLFEIYLTNTTRKSIKLLLLYNVFLINSCNCHGLQSPQKEEIKNQNNPSEIIVFLGNPGAGKSTLCNSIFGEAVFKSGVSLGKGMSIHKQEYLTRSKLYIDTPGLNNVDVKMRQQAATEIEKAFKYNNNYKVVFVITLDRGRASPSDFVTINLICDAIKTNFEYGLVFNQVTEAISKEIEKSGGTQKALNQYLTSLHKKPSSYVILKRVEGMEDEKDMYFKSSDENRKKLISFIDDLKSSKIKDDNITQIDIMDPQEKINVMEKQLKKLKDELESLQNNKQKF